MSAARPRPVWSALLALVLMATVSGGVLPPAPAHADLDATSAPPGGEGEAGLQLTDLPLTIDAGRVEVGVFISAGLADTGARLELALLDAVADETQLRAAHDGRAGTPLLASTSATAEAGDQRIVLDAPDLPPGVYPLRLRLLAAGAPVATLGTAVVAPPPWGDALGVALLVPVGAPASPASLVGPPGDLLTHDLQTGLGIPSVLEGLSAAPSIPLTLVVDALTLEVLDGASDGYTARDEAGTVRADAEGSAAARARQAFAQLRDVAARPETDLVATPYAQADLAALGDAGLSGLAGRAVGVGLRRVEQLLGPTVPGTLWAPTGLGRNGVQVAADAGVDRVLVGVPGGDRTPGVRGQQLRGGGGSRVRALLVEPDLDVVGAAAQPQLFAQELLTFLALRHQDGAGRSAPAPLVLPATLPVPAGAVRHLVEGVAQAPYLRPVTLAELSASAGESTSASQGRPALSSSYLAALEEAAPAVEALSRTLPDSDVTPESAGRLLLAATSVHYAGDGETAGRELLDAVRAAAAEVEAAVEVAQGPQISLTAEQGEVPVIVSNAAPTALRVRVRLRSSGFSFPDGAARVVVLPADGQRLLTFDVRSSRAGGTAPIDVVVTSADGREVLARGRVVVRSTAYPVTAIALVVLAALVLAAWGVQSTRRRRSRRLVVLTGARVGSQ